MVVFAGHITTITLSISLIYLDRYCEVRVDGKSILLLLCTLPLPQPDPWHWGDNTDTRLQRGAHLNHVRILSRLQVMETYQQLNTSTAISISLLIHIYHINILLINSLIHALVGYQFTDPLDSNDLVCLPGCNYRWHHYWTHMTT